MQERLSGGVVWRGMVRCKAVRCGVVHRAKSQVYAVMGIFMYISMYGASAEDLPAYEQMMQAPGAAEQVAAHRP